MMNARHHAPLPVPALALTLALSLLGACGSDGPGDAADAGASADTGVDTSGAGCGADGSPCTPSDPCAAGGTCQAGACVTSGAKPCDDGLDCTTDACDPKTGDCSHTPTGDACAIDGVCLPAGATRTGQPCERCVPSLSRSAWSPAKGPCDDGDACTTDDTCAGTAKGGCAGTAKGCDDGKPCTDDSCDPKTGDCQHPFTSGSCDDGDPCTGDGNCVSGECGPGLAKDCSDGDACTKDTCTEGTGACTSAPDPKACDDGNSCTTDSCAAKAGCSHVALPTGATCSDADACTHGEACAPAGCVGGTKASCDDNNPCTGDTCDPKLGCVHAYLSVSCDDGQKCTVGDSCSGGVCLGQKTTSCPKCSKTFGQTAAQLIGFAIGADGTPGNGLDVDLDPKSCAPKGDCKAGVDNAFAALAFAVNPVLETAIQSGSLRFVADFDGFKGQNVPFAIHLAYAELSPKSASCKPLSQPCGWLVSQQAFTAACKPRVTFADAKLVGKKLSAGGPDTVFAMEVSLQGGDATFLVKGARLEGTLELAKDGKTVVAFEGVIGGSMTEKAVLSTFQGLPDDAFKPLTKAGALALIKSLMVLDIDSDGDGKPESVSVGLKVKAIGATLEGMAP